MKRLFPLALAALVVIPSTALLTACSSDEEGIKVNASIQNLESGFPMVALILFQGDEPVCLGTLAKSQSDPAFELTTILIDSLPLEDYEKGLSLHSRFVSILGGGQASNLSRAEVTVTAVTAKRVSGTARLFDSSDAQVGGVREFEALRCAEPVETRE